MTLPKSCLSFYPFTVAIALGVTAAVALFLVCLIYSAKKKEKIMNTLHNINLPISVSNFSRPSFW